MVVVPPEEIPIGAITNGVHGRTWVSSQMDDLFSKYVSPAWDEAGPDEWAGIDDAVTTSCGGPASKAGTPW